VSRLIHCHAECCNAECHHHAACRYTKCHYAECCGANYVLVTVSSYHPNDR